MMNDRIRFADMEGSGHNSIPIAKGLLVSLVVLVFFPIRIADLPSQNLFVIIAGILWFLFMLWKEKSFSLSVGFLPFGIMGIYLLGYIHYSKPIPATWLVTQRTWIFLFLGVLVYNYLHTEQDVRFVEKIFIFLGLLVSLLSLVEVVSWHWGYIQSVQSLQVLSPPYQASYRIKGSLFGHPNPMAGFLNMVWPMVLVRTLNASGLRRKIAGGVVLLLFAVVFLFANSRGALLGALTGATLLLIIFLGRKTSLGKVYGILGVVFGGMLLLSIGILGRTRYTGQFLSHSFSGRGTIWRFSLLAFDEHPFKGQGIAAFPISYTRLAELPPGDFAPSAHDIFLQIAVDYGVSGVVFVAGLIGVFLYLGFKAALQRESPPLHFSIAYLMGGVAFLSQHLVDFMLVTPQYLGMLVLLLILVLKHALGAGEWAMSRKTFFVLGCGVVGVILILQGQVARQMASCNFAEYPSSIAETNSPVCLSREDDWQSVNDNVHTASALYHFEHAQALAWELARHIQEGIPSQSLLWTQAISHQKAGVEINPYWGVQEMNLGLLYWGNGDYDTSLAILRSVTQDFPMYSVAWLNLGWAEEQRGNEINALHAYTRTLRINPMVNRSVMVEKSPLLSYASRDLFAWMENETAWDTWYDASRHDRARYDVAYWKGIIALALGQSDLAVRYLDESWEQGNRKLNTAVYLAYAHMLSGDMELADKIVQDVTVLQNHEVYKINSPLAMSIAASILHANGENDAAYDLFTQAFEWGSKYIVYERYYPAIYGVQIAGSDVSPWAIRDDLMVLVDTRDDWEWFISEAVRRGDVALSNDVAFWLTQSLGIANLATTE
ncbi:hypothetical protein D6779_08805 [Candidatus Parcubacteria bacterium]|nr:MAG: hypothetical protein D6779_08805 [Candidatus Parcubacteria bacterium]